MKKGFKALDSDMHVYDPPDLYLNYMDKRWGDRIPRGKRDGKHGRVQFELGTQMTLRPFTDVITHGQTRVADRSVGSIRPQ